MRNPVGLRASKEEFLYAIGLDSRDRQHDRYYQAMRDEAINVYRELTRSDLIEEMRKDPNAQPPFYYHHIHPDRRRWANAEIWRRASPETRHFFAMGANDSPSGENWIIAWLLYSVFRSRDERNRRRKPEDKDKNGGGGGAASGGCAPSHSGLPYDPVFDVRS